MHCVAANFGEYRELRSNCGHETFIVLGNLVLSIGEYIFAAKMFLHSYLSSPACARVHVKY